MPERIADVKSVFFGIWSAAQTSLRLSFFREGSPGRVGVSLEGGRSIRIRSIQICAVSIRSGVLREHFGNGLSLGTNETACKILGEERIALCAGDGFLGVFAVGIARAGEGDQRSGKFHLRVVAILGWVTQSERLFHQGVAVNSRG